MCVPVSPRLCVVTTIATVVVHPPVDDKALHCMEPWEKQHSPHSNRHYLMNHPSFTSKQQARAVFCGGGLQCVYSGKTSEDLMLPAQKDGKVLLKFVKTQDGLTFLTTAACGTFAPVNGVSSP